jgi:hypothetical protein
MKVADEPRPYGRQPVALRGLAESLAYQLERELRGPAVDSYVFVKAFWLAQAPIDTAGLTTPMPTFGSSPVRSPSRLKHCEPAQQAISANALMALSGHRGIFVGCIAVTGVTHFVRGPGRARARQDVYEVGATESCVRPADAPRS